MFEVTVKNLTLIASLIATIRRKLLNLCQNISEIDKKELKNSDFYALLLPRIRLKGIYGKPRSEKMAGKRAERLFLKCLAYKSKKEGVFE